MASPLETSTPGSFRQTVQRLTPNSSKYEITSVLDQLHDKPMGQAFLLVDQLGMQVRARFESTTCGNNVFSAFSGLDIVAHQNDRAPKLSLPKHEVPLFPRIKPCLEASEQMFGQLHKRVIGCLSLLESLRHFDVLRSTPEVCEEAYLAHVRGQDLLQKLYGVRTECERRAYESTLNANVEMNIGYVDQEYASVRDSCDFLETVTIRLGDKVRSLASLEKKGRLLKIVDFFKDSLHFYNAIVRLPRSPRPSHPPITGGRNAAST